MCETVRAHSKHPVEGPQEAKCSGDSFPILDLCLSDDKPSSDPAEVPLTKTMRKWHHPISTHLAECPCLCTHSSCEKYICIEFLDHLMVMMMLIIHPFIHPFSLLLLLHSGSWGFWSLSCLPAVFGRRRGYTLDNLPVLLKAHLKRQKNIFNHTHPNGQTRVANSPHLPVFGAE